MIEWESDAEDQGEDKQGKEGNDNDDNDKDYNMIQYGKYESDLELNCPKTFESDMD